MQVDLHDALRQHSYDHALLCTYNFQPDFFEEYCLEQFDSLVANNGITVVMDGRLLDGLVAGPFQQWPRKANVRYLLHGARPKGRFHPKLFFLASRTRGLLVLGSANLTRAGITKNAEMIKVFSFEAGKDEASLSLFQSARAFLRDVAERWPSTEFSSRLGDLDAEVPWLHAETAAPTTLRLCHNLAEPLLPQLVAGIAAPVHELTVLSPYFDEKPLLLDWLRDKLRPAKLTIFTTNGAPSLTPAWTDHLMMRPKCGKFLFGDWGEDGLLRPLHAKAIAIRHGEVIRVAYGSANFTRAALLSTPASGNVETLLVLDDRVAKSVDVAKLFDPHGSGRSEALVPGRSSSEPAETSYPLRLLEATLEGSAFRCVLGSAHGGALEAELLFDGGTSRRVLTSGSSAERRSDLGAEIVKLADRGTTVVSLRSSGAQITNRVLLINLKDVSTGAPSRRERRVMEAQRSANQFAAALVDLIRLGDPDPLQSFLTYCEIPLAGPTRLRGVVRPPVTLSELRAELRQLGARNLREYSGLHEAALGFCTRHVERFGRHARNPTLDAVPSCMHIVRSVAGVIATQAERLIVGLLHVGQLTNNEWFECRRKLDQLLQQWRALMRIVKDVWLRTLQKAYPTEDIRSAMLPDLEPLHELGLGLRNIRGRVVDAMQHFRIPTPSGGRVAPSINRNNIIDESEWSAWSEEVVENQAALESVGAPLDDRRIETYD